MDDFFMNTYHRLPVVFTRGEGSWLFDGEGRRYLDFTSGIAVNCLGHNHPALVSALENQVRKLLHVSNYFQSDVSAALAPRLAAACGMKKVFFCNSGAEANEGAVKIARKYALKKYGPSRHTIVTLTGSFHGRTITTLSATGQERFHVNFGPFTAGFRFTPPGGIAALEAALDESVCAFLVEPIQGESGVRPQEDAFMRAAAGLCAERDILFMADEIQCGLGRAGTFLASASYGVKPDVVTLAKGLSGGVPVGAVLAGEKCADVLEPGDHGSTFGGNALAAAGAQVVLDVLLSPGFMSEIARKGERFAAALRSLPGAGEVRGRGLMLAVDLEREALPLLEAGVRRAGPGAAGLLMLSAGPKTLRFLPPYVISDGEIDEGLAILRELCA